MFAPEQFADAEILFAGCDGEILLAVGGLDKKMDGSGHGE